MALIQCPECTKEVSDTAKSCPQCGRKLQKSYAGKIIGMFAALIVVIVVICLFMSAENSVQMENNASDRLDAALGYHSTLLSDQVKELHDKYFIDKTEILQAMVVFTGYTKDDKMIQKVMPSVLNVAVASKITPAEAADEIGKAWHGN